MDIAYKNEYTNPAENTTEEAKVGLMYTSDYGFAAAPSAWTTSLYNYYSNDASGNKITDENWIYMGLHELSIVRRSDTNSNFFGVHISGFVGDNCAGYSGAAGAIRPVFYLESSVNYVSGSGTKTNPIIIK